MRQFNIVLSNKPSALAVVTETLAASAVNVRGVASEPLGGGMLFKVVTSDEATTRSALKAGNVNFSEREVLSVVLYDRPGELAKLARRLARQMVKVESVFFLTHSPGQLEVAFATDDIARAKEALRDWRE